MLVPRIKRYTIIDSLYSHTRLLTTDKIKELRLEEGGAHEPEEEEPTHCSDTNTVI